MPMKFKIGSMLSTSRLFIYYITDKNNKTYDTLLDDGYIRTYSKHVVELNCYLYSDIFAI